MLRSYQGGDCHGLCGSLIKVVIARDCVVGLIKVIARDCVVGLIKVIARDCCGSHQGGDCQGLCCGSHQGGDCQGLC